MPKMEQKMVVGKRYSKSNVSKKNIVFWLPRKKISRKIKIVSSYEKTVKWVNGDMEQKTGGQGVI